jgi:5'-nucleotidase
MPLALLSNDDGVSSFYLRALAEALKEHFDVVIAAPKCEQSWIGRAMTRRRPVAVEKCEVAGCVAWSIDGTPCDCVNIAMQHLLEGRRPDIVVSGINIGYNAGIPFILSSGTLGAAIEGAVWQCRALAASQKVPPRYFSLLHTENKTVPADIEGDIRAAAAHAAAFAAEVVKAPVESYIVHNLNYPEKVLPETPTEDTLPSAMEPQGLFLMENGVCHFDFHAGVPIPDKNHRTDQDCMAEGTISHGLLDFSRIGRLQNHTI